MMMGSFAQNHWRTAATGKEERMIMGALRKNHWRTAATGKEERMIMGALRKNHWRTDTTGFAAGCEARLCRAVNLDL